MVDQIDAGFRRGAGGSRTARVDRDFDVVSVSLIDNGNHTFRAGSRIEIDVLASDARRPPAPSSDIFRRSGTESSHDSPLEGNGFELSVPREIGFVSN